MGFNPKIFKQVYFDEGMQDKTEGMDFAGRYSVALTVQRYLDRNRDSPTPDNVEMAVEDILEYREEFSEHVILDEDTYYIPIVHAEDRFDLEQKIFDAKSLGVESIASEGLEGFYDSKKNSQVKEKFLDIVRESEDEGRTTIHFNGHGGPEHMWLSRGDVGEEVSDNMHNPRAISFVELGDALHERGDLEDVTIVLDACYTKDFADNLYSYLSDIDPENERERPVIISVTNRGQVGFGSIDSALEERIASKPKGERLTGADFLEIEQEAFLSEDMSFNMPVEDSIIDMGSPFDDGPYRWESDLPPEVIEISKVDESWLDYVYG